MNKQLPSLKAFFLSMLAVFIMASIQYIGFQPFHLLSPVDVKKNIMEVLRPKLEHKKEDYRLKRSYSPIQSVSAAEDYEKASAYIAVDYDSGEIIFEKNTDTSFPIASLTKLMTATVALDLSSADDEFTVPYSATQVEPTSIGVVENQKMSLRELLNAMLLTSANDAAAVIEEGVNKEYDSPIFIKAMNAKAEILGLSHSHFSNPQGFDSAQNYSSVSDLALLTRYALINYPLITEIVQKEYEVLPATSTHKRFDLNNWNGLIGIYPNTKGVKIGNTEGAGKTTIVLSERNGRKVLVALLGAPGVLERDMWAAELLDSTFEKIANLPRVSITEEQLRAKYATWKYYQ